MHLTAGLQKTQSKNQTTKKNNGKLITKETNLFFLSVTDEQTDQTEKRSQEDLNIRI